ncbi:hypothetical protein BN2476_250107 [Paraburkholderia piptadeniae]|uniref:Uncharacterized protein n=1 Tax=Paraburkholderia piptadeniae TaxID=1701573 RepID=A0A1N7S1K8_9BURK|nr:hypothetical protein BN2476_250107 [Paraburkholderia piptadeniae]
MPSVTCRISTAGQARDLKERIIGFVCFAIERTPERKEIDALIANPECQRETFPAQMQTFNTLSLSSKG